MTAEFGEEQLRHWLADYLVTTIGCSPDEVDFNASMNDLGVGSRVTPEITTWNPLNAAAAAVADCASRLQTLRGETA